MATVSWSTPAHAPEESSAASKEKAWSTWADVENWRNAVDFDVDGLGLGYDGDLFSLDSPEFGQADFDPYSPEVNSAVESNSPLSTIPSAASTEETPQPNPKAACGAKALDPWQCDSDTEDFPAVPSTSAGDDSSCGTAYVRMPKWKRRNATKHLEGERNRRAKRKNKVLALKNFLPKMSGKVTTNDLLNATLAKVRELRAKEVSVKEGQVNYREALRSSQAIASIALDEFNRVVEASTSFCSFIQWPESQSLAGQHISTLMHHDDAFKLSMAVEQDRALSAGRLTASQMIGLARFVRGGDKGYSFQPVEMDVSISASQSVLTFLLP